MHDEEDVRVGLPLELQNLRNPGNDLEREYPQLASLEEAGHDSNAGAGNTPYTGKAPFAMCDNHTLQPAGLVEAGR
ncbi:MAG: hypothetical protein WBM14_09695 [Terracidiphilus sp.]